MTEENIQCRVDYFNNPDTFVWRKLYSYGDAIK